MVPGVVVPVDAVPEVDVSDAVEPRSSDEIGQTIWARPEDVARWPTTKGLPGIVAKARALIGAHP